MRRQPLSQNYINRIKFLRGLSIILLLIGLCLSSLYNDYRLLKLNQEKNIIQLTNILAEINNQTILSLTNFSHFVSQTPAPSTLEKRRFSELVSQRLPYIHSISTASAYAKAELTPLLSPRFMLKSRRKTAPDVVEFIGYSPQAMNVITDFIYPLTPQTEPILGLDILSLDLLDLLFNQVPKDSFVRLLNAPNDLHKTVTHAFTLLEGGYAISLNQAVGERAFEGKVYPTHVTSFLLELAGLRDFLANLSANDSLRIQVQTEDGELMEFGQGIAPAMYQVNIEDELTYQLVGRDIILKSAFSFGLQQINWELMLVLSVLGISAIFYFNKLYSVIQRKHRNLMTVNTKLTHNLKTQSDMLGHISHDLNTPLTLISLANQQLQKAKLNNEQSFHLATIENQTQKMTNLVKHILELKTAQRLTLNPQPGDIVSDIKQIVGQFEAQFAQKHIHFLMIDGHVQHLPTHYDHLSLETVLDNLLNNACKYTDAYELAEVYLSLEVGNDDNPQRYLVVHIDNAHPGLTPAQCEQIFTKFVRIDAQGTDGSGLGLGIVKEVCERNGWLIECHSGVRPKVPKQFGQDGYVAFTLSIPV